MFFLRATGGYGIFLTLVPTLFFFVAACSRPLPVAHSAVEVEVEGTTNASFELPRSYAGPAASSLDEISCAFQGRHISPVAFTQFPLPELTDLETLRYSELTSPCVHATGADFETVMQQQRWLQGCLERAEVEDLLIEFHIAGDGRVRRINVVQVEPMSTELGRCLELATLLLFDAEGCSWQRRWRGSGIRLVLEL